MSLNFHIYYTISVTQEDVIGLLYDFAQENNYTFTHTSNTMLEHNMISVLSSQERYVSILARPTLAWIIEDYLLRTINTPVLIFNVYESDFWLYEIYVQNKKIDWFTTNPSFFELPQNNLPQPYINDPAILCSVFPHVQRKDVEAYYTNPWIIDRDWYKAIKAYSNDRYAAGNVFQFTDFINKINFPCPIDEQGVIHGVAFTLN